MRHGHEMLWFLRRSLSESELPLSYNAEVTNARAFASLAFASLAFASLAFASLAFVCARPRWPTRPSVAPPCHTYVVNRSSKCRVPVYNARPQFTMAIRKPTFIHRKKWCWQQCTQIVEKTKELFFDHLRKMVSDPLFAMNKRWFSNGHCKLEAPIAHGHAPGIT